MTVIATAEIDIRLRNNASKEAQKLKKDLNAVEQSAEKTNKEVAKTGTAKTNPFITMVSTFSPRFKKMNKDISGLKEGMGEASEMAGVMGTAMKGAIAGVVVGVAVAGIKKLYDAMKSLVEFASPYEYTQVTNEFNQAVANLKQTVGTWLTPTFTALTQVMTSVVSGLNETAYSLIRISSSVRNIFGLGNAFEDLSQSVDSATSGMASFDKLNVMGSSQYSADLDTAEKIKEASEGSKDIWQDTLDIMKKCPILLFNVYGQLGQIGKDLWESVSGLFSGIDWDGIGKGISSVFTTIFDSITGTIKNVVNFWISAINKVVDGYNATIGSLRVDNDLLNIHFGFPSLDHIPMLASGGVIDADSPMPVIVGDNKTQKEAVAPIETLKQYVREAVDDASQTAAKQNITLEISGRRLATLMYDYNQAEVKRRSATIRG